MRYAIATRNGEPAWKNAPPRKRQSDFDQPSPPMEYTLRPGFLARLFRGRRG